MADPKALKGLEHVGGALSPDQFDVVMAQYAGTQPMRNRDKLTQPVKRRTPGRHVEKGTQQR